MQWLETGSLRLGNELAVTAVHIAVRRPAQNGRDGPRALLSYQRVPLYHRTLGRAEEGSHFLL